MNLNIFNGLPKYVRITICTQVRKLLRTNYFNQEEREDLIHDYLLFYLRRFYTISNIDEALVVHSLQVYTNRLYQKRKRSIYPLTSSLDYDLFNEDFFYSSSKIQDSLLDCTYVNEVMSKAPSEKIKKALHLIKQGYSIDEISRQLHLSKKEIYKFFKKIKNF